VNVLDIFSGIGGFSLGLEKTGGFRTIAFCEIETFCQKILKHHWPEVPIFPDVQQLGRADLPGTVDVVCGGFPCQDLSVAGYQKGLQGTRSGLWGQLVRIIGEVQPRYAIVENVTGLLSGPGERPGAWFGRVLGDLTTVGYDAEWHCIPAAFIGAPHFRDRVWIIAYPAGFRRDLVEAGRPGLPILCSQGLERLWEWPGEADFPDHLLCDVAGIFTRAGRRAFRNDDGIQEGLDRLKAAGNAVVPQIPFIIGRAILQAEKALKRCTSRAEPIKIHQGLIL
jgi:DNA (cytosine-5)-methyltransferase 1